MGMLFYALIISHTHQHSMVSLFDLHYSANDCQCIPNPVANVLPTLLPMSSSSSCPSSRKTVPRVFRVLLPVSCSASCPCLPSPHARHHLALTLVITPLSRSCLPGRCFPREGRRGLTSLFEESPKSLHTIAGRQYNKKPLRIHFLSGQREKTDGGTTDGYHKK